jgi:pSer/pThr/pTyr-binding forkhead associated (FHA) protein
MDKFVPMSEPPNKSPEEAAPETGRPDEPTLIGGVPVFVAKQQKPLVLRQIKGPGFPRDVNLDIAEVVIGRALESNVSVDSPLVSRRHAAIKRGDAGYSVEDLESGNGVFVNGERVQTAPLRPNDTLQIGDALFVVQPLKTDSSAPSR